MNDLTIGALAKSAGVGVETVRYYQRRGLLPPNGAHKGAFRVYGYDELARLRFIRRAQTLGFSLDEVSDLLALDEETDRERARAFARAKIADVESRIRQLEEMRNALQGLVSCCEHTEAPAPCPILHALANAAEPMPAPRGKARARSARQVP
ncbi:MAG: MerR family transcriptional regulator, mercuric resistance operon regulatory protein [Azoarcus sp.]|uniref:MerR family transcriptional regulator, mercuric resistance operon regulatory protein n=1 Tax=Aromatoleum tolulyticum TaxID=34027 RepID=A0A1N6RGF5_9RHOO|nr:MerR family DNA-binding protein [Aromatoleum tolulyticum]MCK9985608.1 MerR family transcriptional regulator, mercuric resistance operon regulatory protein [Azoarcus sp.]SIQ27950.1 MerR family transcriptional regulator, mercuric resistance operon regulatory protein [Aromatoleum tolulyticum]